MASSSSEFRKLLNDAVILLRDIAGDAATKSASHIGPSEEQLRQMDNPAPDHQWHNAPSLSRENFKNQVCDQFSQNKPVPRGEAREAVGSATQAARSASDQRSGTASGIDASSGVHAGAAELRQRADEDVPEEHKQRAREYRERASNYVQNKIPQERREHVIFRLKKMVVEIQSHKDYQQAIDTLLGLAETYTGHTRGIARDGTGTVKGAHEDSHLQSVEKSLKVCDMF